MTRELGNSSLEATILDNIAKVYADTGQPKLALDYLQEVLSITKAISDRSLEATTLNNLGLVYDSMGQLQQAIEYYQQALLITREISHRTGEATTLGNLGLVYSNIGQPQEALNYYQQALSIKREVGDRPGEASTLTNIGVLYADLGQPQEALNYLQQGLSLSQAIKDPGEQATALNNIGIVYSNLGQPQEALNYYQQALPLSQQVGDRSLEATTLNNIGLVYESIGQPLKALNYVQQALPIFQEVGDRRAEGSLINTIGWFYSAVDKPKEALDHYQQALSIAQETDNKSLQAVILSNMGGVYGDMEQPQESLKFYQQALSIGQEIGDRPGVAITLNNLGTAYYNLEEPTEALDYYQQALSMRREIGDRNGEADSLTNIGYLYQDSNRPTEAIQYFEDAVTITLEMRGSLKRENRKTFLKQEENTTVTLIELLIEQNQPEKAFEWANLTTTFDLADYNRLINAQVANPEIQKELDDWNEKNEQLNFLRQQLADEFSTAKAQQVNELQAELNLQAEAIADQYPEVAELFEIQPTDIAVLRENIAPDTAIIQPVILSDKIGLFILTAEDLKVITQDIDPENFNQLITQYREQLADYKNADVFVTGEQIYDLLIRPIESEIKTIAPENLAIIATGKLRYIPFETLSDPETGEFLLEKYPIHYLTRISTRKIPPNSSFQNGKKTLSALALANPKPTNESLLGTEKEAQHLTENFPGSEAYLGTDATLKTFKDNASRFPILHLGTHGCFDPDGCPNLGMEANTILFANNEQYNIADAALLGLKNTEILALSACQTAKEANANGRELSGLAFVLERAGAKTVMASLWNAEDNVSANIMTNFYTNMKQGMSKNEAMRQAKLSHLRTGEKSHPFFWSPFILIGDV